MQALTEFAPLLAFFVAYYLRGLYVATAVLMIAMLILLAVDWLRTRRIPAMHALSTVLVVIFGLIALVDWLRGGYKAVDLLKNVPDSKLPTEDGVPVGANSDGIQANRGAIRSGHH